MAHTAYLPIIADRYGAVVRHIFLVGLDLTGIDMRAQVRLYGDVPGTPLVDLVTVTNGNAEGLRLVEVTSDANGLPTSHVEIVINETTMEALPYAGEIGDVTTLAWDWQVTIAGRKRRLAKGEFQITGDGVTGASVAPANRIAPYGLPQRPVIDVWSSARMTFGEEQVSVTIDGADLVAPLAKRATDAADRATADAAKAGLSSGAAQATARYFTTRAAGEAASTTDQSFATDDGAGNVIYYRKTSAGSVEIGRAVTPAALAAGDGAKRVGFKPTVNATARSIEDDLGDRISLTRYIQATEGQDQSPAFARAFADLNTAGGRGATLYLPGGRGGLTATQPIMMPDRVKLVGDGSRSTIINAAHNGPMVVFDSVTHGALRGVRLGLGPASVGIEVKTTSISIRLLDLVDIEVAGAGADRPGQIGLRLQATGTDPAGSNNIVTECRFQDLYFFEVDRPVVDLDTEGNFFERITIDQFCYSKGVAFDSRGLANFYMGVRIAGAPAAGSIGYRQAGLRTHSVLITDIGNSAEALDLSEGRSNIVQLQRPLQDSPFIQTPMGKIGRTNRVIEGARHYSIGSLPVGGANISLDGFGDGAQVLSISGDDANLQFTIKVGGPGGIAQNGPGSHPRIIYSFADGKWPYSGALLSISCGDGDKTGFAFRNRQVAATGWSCEVDVQPVTGQSYVIQAQVR